METSQDTAARSRSKGAGLKETIKRDGRAKIESGKSAAADQIDEIADAIDVAGAELDQSQPGMAGYASRLADGVATLAARLRDGSIEELTRDARQLAARNPAMFLLGGAALGVVAARFFKARESAGGAATEMEASQSFAGSDAARPDSASAANPDPTADDESDPDAFRGESGRRSGEGGDVTQAPGG